MSRDMAQEAAWVLSGLATRSTKESEVQAAIERALEEAGVRYSREVVLCPKCRLDFYIDGLAIEVKLQGTAPSLIRQIHRYSMHNEVRELLVVTNLSRLTQMPLELNGKPVRVQRVGYGL
jgi:hypothetical protein